MSTHCYIARRCEHGTRLQATEVRFDGAPMAMLPELHALVARDGARRAAHVLVTSGEWASIDPNQPSIEGVTADVNAHKGSAQYRAWMCEAQGTHSVPGYGDLDTPGTDPLIITDDDLAGLGWVYVFDRSDVCVFLDGKLTGALTMSETGSAGYAASTVREIAAAAECGTHLQHCGHKAHVHYPDIPEESRRLSAHVWMGIDPLTASDALAVIVDGVQYDLRPGSAPAHAIPAGRRVVGSGPGRYRYSSTADGDPVLVRVEGGDGELLDGVEYIFPPVAAVA